MAKPIRYKYPVADAQPPQARPTFRLWDAIALPSVTNALFAVVVALLLGSVAAAVVSARTPVYRSAVLLEIDQPQAIAASGDIGVIDKLNRLVPKYAVLARTARITVPVSDRIGLPVGEIAAAVSAAPLGQSLLLSIAAQDSDRETAQQMAQAVADELTAYAAQEQEANQIPPEQRFHFTEIQGAGPGGKISPTRDDAVASGAVAALVGLAIAYLLLQVATAERRL